MINIHDQDTASSNKFPAFTNNNDDNFLSKIHENSEKVSLRQSNNNILRQLIINLNAHSKTNMVTDSKRKINISSNSKNAKNKNMLVIIKSSIIKCVISGIQLDYKKNNQKRNHC